MSFASRDRRTEFKRGIDGSEQRRKREDTSVEIRKSKRDEHLTKRRMREADAFGENENAKINTAPEEKFMVTDLPKLVEGLKSSNVEECLKNLKAIRKMLSIEQKPPIDAVLQHGVLPIVVSLMMPQYPAEVLFEGAWVITNIASGNTNHVQQVCKSGVVQRFIAILNATGIPSVTNEVQDQVAWALGNIAGDCTAARDMVLGAGVMKPLVKLVDARIGGPSTSRLRDAVWVLSNMCRGKPQPNFDLVSCAVDVIARILKHEDQEVLTDACWALSYLSDDSTPHNIKIERVRNTGCVPRLVQLLLHSNSGVRVPALRTLGNMVTGNDEQTETVLACNFIPALLKLLNTGNKKTVRKEVCWAISNIAAGPEIQIQKLIESGTLKAVSDIMSSTEHDVRKEITWIFANVALGGNKEQIKYLTNLPLVACLSEQLSVNDVAMLTTTLDVLAAMLKSVQDEVGNSNNRIAIELERHGGLDKMDELQTHENGKLAQKAQNILSTYFDDAGDDELRDAAVAPCLTSNASQFAFGDAPATSSNFSFGSAGGPVAAQPAFVFN